MRWTESCEIRCDSSNLTHVTCLVGWLKKTFVDECLCTANSPTWSWISSATPGTLYSSPRDWFILSSMTRRCVNTWGQRSEGYWAFNPLKSLIIRQQGWHRTYLRANLSRLLGVDHAHVLEVFERVLSVLLLGPHVFLQQTEHVPWLRPERDRNKKERLWGCLHRVKYKQWEVICVYPWWIGLQGGEIALQSQPASVIQ